jgi:hypothetical protein
MSNDANAKTPSSSPVKAPATATMLSDEEKKKIVKKKEKSIKAFVKFQETLVKEGKRMRLPKTPEASPFNAKPYVFLKSVKIKEKDTDEEIARKERIQAELVRQLKVQFPDHHKDIERIPWFSPINGATLISIDKFVQFQETLVKEGKRMRLPKLNMRLKHIKIKEKDTDEEKAKMKLIQAELRRQLEVQFPDHHKDIERIPWFSTIDNNILTSIDNVIVLLRQDYDSKNQLFSPRHGSKEYNFLRNNFLRNLKKREYADEIYEEIMRQAKIEFDVELQDGAVKEEEISQAIRLESKNDTRIHSEQIRKLGNICNQLNSDDGKMDKDTAQFCKRHFHYKKTTWTTPQYLKQMLRRLHWKDEAEDPDGLKRKKEQGGAYFNDFLDKYGNGQKPLWDILHEELDIPKLKDVFPAEFHKFLGKSSADIEAYVEQSLTETVKFSTKQKAYLIQVLKLDCEVSGFNKYMLQKESELKQGSNLVATIQIKKDDTQEIEDAMEAMELTVSADKTKPEVEVVITEAEAATPSKKKKKVKKLKKIIKVKKEV